MKIWPGTETFDTDNTPWNVMSTETLLKDLADRGSTTTALTATLLGYLADENNTTLISALDDSATSTLDYRETMYFECDMDGVLALYGACLFLGSTYKFDYSTAQRWHKVRRVKGLYKDNYKTYGTDDFRSVQLTDTPSLIDDVLTVAAVASITHKNIHMGVEVGGEEYGTVYGNTVDALLIVSSSSSLGNLSLYKSSDNRTWEAITKSSYSANGWASGEKAVTNCRGSGSSIYGRLVMFAQPETARYFSAVQTSALPSFDLYEVYPLNLQGELRYSADLANWNGAARDTTFTDYLLFKFDSTRNKVRAVEYYVDPFDPTSSKAARVDIDHIEIYNNTESVDFLASADAASERSHVIQITDGDLGEAGTGQLVYVYNNDPLSRTAKKMYAHIPINPRNISGLSVTAGASTFQLADATNRVTYCRYILNSGGTDIGAFGTSSVDTGGGMIAWTEVASGATGTQYSVNYNTGLVTFGSAVPAGSTITFKYASPGAAALQFSTNNVDWKACGYVNRTQLAGEDVVANSSTYLYVRSDQTYFTQTVEDVIKSALLVIEALYQGE